MYDEELERIQTRINIANVDEMKLKQILEETPPPNYADVDQSVTDFYTKSDALTRNCKKQRKAETTRDMKMNRWKKITQKK